MEETISILRGLRERYEVHHGVRITDSALVAAAVLCNRYISDRFLPDKAIDLVDEAASRLRMEIDSMPVELDELERRRIQLEIEREALRKEKDDASKARLEALEQELAEISEEGGGLKSQWEKEKAAIAALRQTKSELEALQHEIEAAERAADYGRAAELKYGRQVELQDRLQEQEAAVAAAGGATPPAQGGGRRGRHRPHRRHLDRHPGDPAAGGRAGKLIHMEERLHERVVGQDEAIAAVSDAVRRARAGLKDPQAGPSARSSSWAPPAWARPSWRGPWPASSSTTSTAMTRIDMSEYMEKYSVSRLIGAPPGYVGYDEGGQLTEAVRRRPYQVVLLDEIEKAHPDVFNVLLQVLDDGRLTDGQGRTVNFKNTVIIMTSNIGSQFIAADGGRTDEAAYEGMKRQVTEALRPPVPAGVPQPHRRDHRLPRPHGRRPGGHRGPAAGRPRSGVWPTTT